MRVGHGVTDIVDRDTTFHTPLVVRRLPSLRHVTPTTRCAVHDSHGCTTQPELRVSCPANHGREEGSGVALRVGDVPHEAHVCKLVGF